MRYSLTYVSLALLGALQVQGSCVEGAREEILPGYTVEYSCGVYQEGTSHKPIASAEDCAKLCQGSGREICSYGDAAKVCVVGEPGKAHKTSPGVIYMKHVEEDPFKPEDPEDPFQPTPEDCDEQLSTCESDLAKYKPASVDCPANHKKVAEVKGKRFLLECNTLLPNAGVPRIGTFPSLEGCIEKCISTSGCKYVTWRPSNQICWGGSKDAILVEGKRETAFQAAHLIN